MLITTKDIKWGSYREHEGPFFRGVHKYKLPSRPDIPDKFIATIAATEGSAFDAINMYDSMIISNGIIQWAEAGQFSVSDMLGAVATKVGVDYVLTVLEPALKLSNATFKKSDTGKWRFFVNGSIVDTVTKQRSLFLGCSGRIGSWSESTKLYAKVWAACVANIWDLQEAREVQIEYTKKRLMGFVTTKAKEILFSDVAQNLSVGWTGAVRAAYLSFAANLPAVAALQLEKVVNTTIHPKWSENWCISVIKSLTFGPGIAIYPTRYDKIRPVIEEQFGVELPKTSSDLRAWEPGSQVIVPPPIPMYDYKQSVIIRDDPAIDVPLVPPSNIFTIVVGFFTWLLSLLSGGKK